jgi:hypothetical protein
MSYPGHCHSSAGPEPAVLAAMLANTLVTLAATIAAAGLVMNGDGLQSHYQNNGLRSLGKLYSGPSIYEEAECALPVG